VRGFEPHPIPVSGPVDPSYRDAKIGKSPQPVLDPQPAIFPGWTAPVIRKADDGERELSMMSWGFVLLQDGKAPRRVTDVRDDKILTSRFWTPSFQQRRCLVRASSYCEPDSGKPAQWHWFAVNGDDDRPLFAFPGIWQHYPRARFSKSASSLSSTGIRS
jgi:putative SOS response-associated peptidase YedK